MRKLKLDIKGFSLVEVTIGAGILALVMAQVGYQSMVSSRNAASTSLSGDFNAIFSAIDQTIKTPGGCDAMFSNVPFDSTASFPQYITRSLTAGAVTITPGSTLKGLEIQSMQFTMIQPNINISGEYSQHTVNFQVTGQKVDLSGKPFPGASTIVRNFTLNVWEKNSSRKLATNAACSGNEISVPVITNNPTLLQVSGTISPVGPSCVLPSTPLILNWGELYATWGKVTTTWGYSSTGSQNAHGPISLTAPATTGSYTATVTNYSGSDANGSGPSATGTSPAVVVSPSPTLSVTSPIAFYSPAPQTVTVNYTTSNANQLTITYPNSNPIPLTPLAGPAAIVPIPQMTPGQTYNLTITASNGCGVTNVSTVNVQYLMGAQASPTPSSTPTPSPSPSGSGQCGPGTTETFPNYNDLCSSGSPNYNNFYSVNGSFDGPPYNWTCTGSDNIPVHCNTTSLSGAVCGLSVSGIYGYNGYTTASCTAAYLTTPPNTPAGPYWTSPQPWGVWNYEIADLNAFCGMVGCAGYNGQASVNYCNYCPNGTQVLNSPCGQCAYENPYNDCNLGIGMGNGSNPLMTSPSQDGAPSNLYCCATNTIVTYCK